MCEMVTVRDALPIAGEMPHGGMNQEAAKTTQMGAAS